MNKFLNLLKIMLVLVLTLVLVFPTSYVITHAEEAGPLNANIDIVDGKEILMPRTSTGVVVDGYQLNHDYVKILNINNGNIIINDENYSQGVVTEPWSSQEDAYVVKGKGSSVNTITINPTSAEITVYLVDIEWNGQIVIDGMPTKVNIIVCGNSKNTNSTGFIYSKRLNGEIYVGGLPESKNSITSNNFIHEFYTPYYQTPRIVSLQNLTVNTNSLYTRNHLDEKCISNTLNMDNVILNNKDIYKVKAFENINITNSKIEYLNLAATNLISSNSEINNVSYFITGGKVTSNNDVITFITPVKGEINAKHSTLRFNSSAPSSITKMNFENCSLYSAIAFAGTPVDKDADDLYLKKIRLRQYANTYVMISVNGGSAAKLKTDENGFLYPYVKKGTTKITATLDNGQEFYAIFPATTGNDNTTTNLIQDTKTAPTIIDLSKAQNITLGETLRLFVTAVPGTAGSNLSYQWYKNDIKIPAATQSDFTISEVVSNDSGTYKCIVTEDKGGFVTSDNILVVIGKPEISNNPVILSQTADMDLIQGSSVTLIVNAVPSVATNTLSYQWYKDGIPIDASDYKLTLADIEPNQAGSYKCVVKEENFDTTVDSGIVNITVKEFQ